MQSGKEKTKLNFIVEVEAKLSFYPVYLQSDF